MAALGTGVSIGSRTIRVLQVKKQKDGTWQDVFLMAPSFHIAGGTDEIQKNQAAERVLGLPREVQPDRDVPFDQIARS